MKFRTSFLWLSLGALMLGAIFMITQAGRAQDRPPVEPLIIAQDAWGVDVKNACLVDTVTVESGTEDSKTQSQDTFNTGSRMTEGEVAGSAEGKAACAAAKAEARKELPKKLWEAGDKLCMQEEKAPAGKKECKAIRGNLHGPDIQCSCSFEGLNPIQEKSSKWRVTATCRATKNVTYVCDP